MPSAPSLEPDSSDWTWGLELVSYGLSGGERLVMEPEEVTSEGQRIAYAWSEDLDEWYINDHRGLEHGYTVHGRPAWTGEGERPPLVFTLSVRGGLHPRVDADGRDLYFVDDEGAVLLSYTGLKVTDADDQELEASFELAAGYLRLRLDDRGARYPLTVDPVAQQAYLKASNTDPFDLFANSVAVSGNTVVVGAPEEESNAVGVNGDQSNNLAGLSGAVYVFVRNGTSWSQEAYLKASNTDVADIFGHSLSLSADTAVIGAPNEESMATGVNGDQDDDTLDDAGAAYTFEFDLSPGAPFCFGDPGSGTPCPCANDNDGSVPGSGCANGVFPSGARLIGSGVASVSNDTLVLVTSGMEPQNSGLYFQANNDLSPGVVWGDGLRCTGGQLKRLGVRFADATGASDTSAWTTPISVKAGNVQAGDTRYYQCWYRNPLSSPCGAEFNASNGYAIVWGP